MNMKRKLRPLVPTCLVFLTLFAGSALAQEQEAAPDQGAPARPLQFPLKLGPATPNHASQSSGKTQEQLKSEAVGSDHTSTCTYTFTSGSGFTYLQFCVTKNGNIVEFQSPVNVEQIRQGSYGEGYGICDLSTEAEYYDFADNGDSSNWKAPSTVTHTATMVKIERTTTDGLWTLTQTITSTPGTNPSAKVLMALKNNSSTSKEALLFRWADVDPGQAAGTDTSFDENFDGTLDSAWGYISDVGNFYPYGLMFQNVGNPVPASVPYLRGGFVLTAPPIDTCNATESSVSPLTNADGATIYIWLVELNKEQSVSVTGRYLSF
jgi:hypothetical protein